MSHRVLSVNGPSFHQQLSGQTEILTQARSFTSCVTLVKLLNYRGKLLSL